MSYLPITRTSKENLPSLVSISTVSVLTNSCKSQTQGQQQTWMLADSISLGFEAFFNWIPLHKLRVDGLTGEPEIGQNPPKSSLISLTDKLVDLYRRHEEKKVDFYSLHIIKNLQSLCYWETYALCTIGPECLWIRSEIFS